MARIYGIDISHWQKQIDWRKVRTDFAIMKVSQGTSFVDGRFKENQKGARDNKILVGYYHFANGTDPIKEAKHFVSTIGEIRKDELLVLDWEINRADPAEWCKRFLDEIKEITGVKALLYTNEARAKSINWKPVVDGDYGLWVAKHGTNTGKPQKEPSSGAWKFWVIWQYTSRGTMSGINGNVDLNLAEVDLETLKKYGFQGSNNSNDNMKKKNQEFYDHKRKTQGWKDLEDWVEAARHYRDDREECREELKDCNGESIKKAVVEKLSKVKEDIDELIESI